ncbi:TPA: hypothetical protein ACPJ2D_004474 [Vibrio alginolyticus]
MNMTRGAVMLGQKASFRRFLSDLMGIAVRDEKDAANAVRTFCDVQSRRELNMNHQAADRYRALVRLFNRWMNNEPLDQENHP